MESNVAMFRFTIRDLLWLTVVVAMGCGWWFHYSRQLARQQEAARIHHADIRQLLGEAAALKENNAAMEQWIRKAEQNAGAPAKDSN